MKAFRLSSAGRRYNERRGDEERRRGNSFAPVRLTWYNKLGFRFKRTMTDAMLIQSMASECNKFQRKSGADMSKLFNAKNLMIFIFSTFIVSIGYVTVRIILAPTAASASDIDVRVKSDYTLMLFQCCFGSVAMLLPGYLRRKVQINIPNAMMIAYAVFLFCGIYLGEVRDFYFRVPHWDTVLHIFSGVALGALGFSIISMLNKSESVLFSLSPAFVALFAFCFALALGALWEIYEFSVDTFLHTNSQKYALETGEQLIGRAALLDTMKDLIVDALGALTVSIIGYASLKHNKGWLEWLQIKPVTK